MLFFRETESRRQEDYEWREHSYSSSYPYTQGLQTPSSPLSCSQGHRSSLRLETPEGGAICLVCFCNLISNPSSPSVHVSYALSQLSEAISNPAFLQNLRTFHAHLLISPLVQALSSFDDEPIARQTIDLVADLCDSEDPSVCPDFIARISDRLSSGALAWSRRQNYMLHCFGVLLNRRRDNPSAHIKDKSALISNLITGLQLPSEEIRGEILFVLYKVSILDDVCSDDDDSDHFFAFSLQLLHLSLDALMKTQSDDVRLNCIALLTVLAQKGYLGDSFLNDQIRRDSAEADNFIQTIESGTDETPLIFLFAEAIKGPLLSSDSQVQIGTLDLIIYYLTWENAPVKQIEALIEESIADYVFEILRVSGCKDPALSSCIRVLDLLSRAEQVFKQRLFIGFSTLIPVLCYVAELPFHPVQTHVLKLILSCISNCPGTGIASRSRVEELVVALTVMFRRHTSGELGMLPETFILACSIFVEILRSPTSLGISTLATSVKEASENAILACFTATPRRSVEPHLHALYLMKESYIYGHEENCVHSSVNVELCNSIIEVCKTHLIPWVRQVLDEGEEEDIILGVLETFHSILLHKFNNYAREFTDILVSSSWFSLSFGFLGLFPTEKMKWRIYLVLGSLVDEILGQDSGQPIRDAVPYLLLDPLDLLFLLGQKSSDNLDLLSCQSAVLLILYTSSLYDERLADEKQVLASLEQYILVNSSNLLCGMVDSMTLIHFIHLYSLYRGIAKMSYQIPYSPEAEKLLFHLIIEQEWNMLSVRLHPTALKWLFQQEKIIRPLSYQILNFCRYSCSSGSHIILSGNNSMLDVPTLAVLVGAGDNFGATLLVSLLKQLQEEEGQEDDLDSVMNIMVEIVSIFPSASNQLCLHGIGNAIHNLYYSSIYSSSQRNFINSLLLIFNILRSAQPETLFDQDGWLPVTMKLLEFLIPDMAKENCSQQGLLVIGILSLILHHSTKQALVEGSKAILLNGSLVCKINSTIHAACSKGPALVEHDEDTNTGETLIFVLLLCFFALRSVHILLPESLGWENFFGMSNEAQPLSLIYICCHDLCRLMYFGSPAIKLVASNCLLELLAHISDQLIDKHKDLECPVGYLKSVMAVLEGLLFYSDIRVALNCGLGLSMILGWEKLGRAKAEVVVHNKWYRLIVEELAMSLVAPSLASKTFMNHYKPAAHVAIALLRLTKVPEWMRNVLGDSCISGVVQNLATSNVSIEIVNLFHQLLRSGFLNAEQIASLNLIFQGCRRHLYTNNFQDTRTEAHLEKVVSMPDDLGKVCESLTHIMLCESYPSMASREEQNENKRLLEGIDMFFKESSTRG